jgi:hypothetical protein
MTFEKAWTVRLSVVPSSILITSEVGVVASIHNVW